MKVIHPDTPLKVVRKLLRKNINIGVEGTLDCFLCDTLEENPQRRALLMIFVGRYEEISLKLVAVPPESMDGAEVILKEALEKLQTCYVDISMQERNQCLRVH